MQFKLTVDCVVLAYDHTLNRLLVLLTKRSKEPQLGRWALPGGFVTRTEEFIHTAQRKLEEETGVRDLYLEQLKAYSLTDASIHNRIASVAFYALLKWADYAPMLVDTNRNQWVPVNQMPALPFDHPQKVADALTRLKQTIKTSPVAFYLLPIKFSLKQLQQVYELIYGYLVDTRNFRKGVKGLPYITAINEVESNVSHRPAQLYRFDLNSYQVFTATETV
ncbi:NUDIX hydrolase [Spirosoma pollinicola]|uniref:NUDIX hydrolase n=1 Tax=Spirosoma pollinicola TaxID=2057025 RepID=A0A2K8Z8I1_9BACT|nr:NUDIX domain-containing protein [Spirosoma pollinicola]AUD06160.1 NUDIX hydrolase [Spirosoma pollinicola]